MNEQEDYIYGMVAFPLLELGRMADADKAARKGYDINKDDPWVQHAVSQTYVVLAGSCMHCLYTISSRT